MYVASRSEVRLNFRHLERLLMQGEEIVLTKYGKIVGRIIPEREGLTRADETNGVLKPHPEKE